MQRSVGLAVAAAACVAMVAWWMVSGSDDAVRPVDTEAERVEPVPTAKSPRARAAAPAPTAPPEPDEPAEEAEEDRSLEARFEAYLAQWGDDWRRDLAPGEQDAALSAALRDKAEALQGLVEAYTPIAEGDDPPRRYEARVRLGELYEEMGAWMEALPAPSYLTEGQAGVYAQAVGKKVAHQRALAAQMYEAALEDLPAGADGADVDAALDRLAGYEEDEEEP